MLQVLQLRKLWPAHAFKPSIFKLKQTDLLEFKGISVSIVSSTSCYVEIFCLQKYFKKKKKSKKKKRSKSLDLVSFPNLSPLRIIFFNELPLLRWEKTNLLREGSILAHGLEESSSLYQGRHGLRSGFVQDIDQESVDGMPLLICPLLICPLLYFSYYSV